MDEKERMKLRSSKFFNRSRLEIIAELLECAKQGLPKMHLVYGARLSHRIGTAYIKYLLEAGLIEKSIDADENRTYRTSDMGLKYLQLYKGLSILAETRKPTGITTEERSKELTLSQTRSQAALVQVTS
jgi:predicted transcriptional regulator